jgi:hypothetical protein
MNKKIKEYLTLRIINAVIIALITFLSSMTIQYPPTTVQFIYAPFIAFCLTLLIQLRGIIQELISQEKPPKKKYRNTTTVEQPKEDNEDSKWDNLLVLL